MKIGDYGDRYWPAPSTRCKMMSLSYIMPMSQCAVLVAALLQKANGNHLMISISRCFCGIIKP